MAVKASSQISMIDVTDAYSVLLTSEAYAFTGNTSGAPAGLTCTTQVVAFCGQKSCTSLNVSNISCPTGITATVSNNNTASPTVTFKTTATITATCEAIIPVSVDGITINKKFSFAVAKTGSTGAKGDTGQQGPQGPQGVKGDTGAAGKDGVNGTNLWVNPLFEAGKPQITSIDTSIKAPNGANVNLIKQRDHFNVSTAFPVFPGHAYRIILNRKRKSGTVQLYAGICYTSKVSGGVFDSYVSASSTKTLTDGWEEATYNFTCPNGKSKGCVFLQLDQANSGGDTAWYVSNIVCSDITGLQGAKGETGATGATGIGVKSTAVTYQVSSSGTTAPTGTWSTSVPSVSAGQFLWTRTIITYSNNTTSTLYSVGRNGTNGVNGTNGTNGQNGKSIGQVVNYYLATNASSNVTASTSGWTTTVQSVSSSKKYLWNYEVVKYTDGTIASTTAPCIIGSYGDTGAKGEKGAKGDTGAAGPTGVGIKSITEYYAVSTTNTTAPTSWVTSIPTLTASNKYLWNYETVTYTNNSTVSTSKRVIGVYGDKGAKGDTGAKGDKGPQGPQGVKGDTGAAGNGIASTAVVYQAGSSGTTAPTGTWSTSVPSTSAAAPYLWTRITIKYTNGTVTNSYSVGSTPEGISVGGRNLAVSTNQGTNGWGWSMKTGGHTQSEIVENNIRTCKLLRNSTAQSGWSVIEYTNIGRSKYEPNTVYTVSFDVKSNVNTVMNIDLLQGNGTDNLMDSSTAVNRQIKANQWNKLIWIIKTVTTLPSSTGQLLYITAMNSGTGVWYQFKNLKIEKGNKATDWSPAPEDIDTKFNNYTTTEQMKHDFKNNSSELYSAINSSFATNGQVSAVDGKFSNYYTKTTIDSTIKQVKDSISMKVSQTDFDKQTKATSASLELKLNKTDNNKVVAMLNASADTISLKSNRFTLDSTYTKIAADGTITCSNLNCTNAKITGGSVNITASNKEENKIILSYQGESIKLAPCGIELISAPRYAFKLTPMKLTMSFSGGGIEANTTIDPNGVSTGSVKAGTIVASSVLKIGPQSYGSNAATGARLEATNQDLRLYASPETTYYVRLGVDYSGSTVKHGWHFGPDGGGSVMLGTSSHAWSNGFFDGTVYIQHGDMHISTGSCYCYDYYYIWSGGGWVELSNWIAARL